jgi:hypothetical protein
MERRHSEDLFVDGRIILKWNFEKWCGCIDWIHLAHDRDRWRGCCEFGNKFLVSIKCEKFLDQLKTC